jgi:hypothetical protein
MRKFRKIYFDDWVLSTLNYHPVSIWSIFMPLLNHSRILLKGVPNGMKVFSKVSHWKTVRATNFYLVWLELLKPRLQVIWFWKFYLRVWASISQLHVYFFEKPILLRIFCQVFLLLRFFLVLRFFQGKVGFSEVEIKG